MAGGLNIEFVRAPSADAVMVRLAVIIFVADSKRSGTAVAHPQDEIGAASVEAVLLWKRGLVTATIDNMRRVQARRDLATNPAVRTTLGERAMAHVTRHYDASTNASRLLGLLKEEANAARAERLAAPTARFA